MTGPRPEEVDPTRCGGCQGAGSHRKHCPRHPDYHPWRVLADRQEDIGDRIGGNDPGLANQAYAIAGRLREMAAAHPWRWREREPGS